ncbi:MAG: dTDP-4-dehydrorhamnose reductase [Porticoccaceae bacterium]|jgi:dTDP-4-dehydrorhamnose reductase|nr:dTDP-4-dehydrorhamnose reductase [Porticoccaceae bacterium]
MRILLLGANGQLGLELRETLAPLGELIPLDRHGDRGLGGDLGDAAGIASTLRELRPDLIVNAAAHTAVDRAESEPDLAHAVNAVAPGVLAEGAARLGSWLVHYSTDYVFDGSGGAPWRETDIPNPLNTYGRSKLAGERAIEASGCRHLILRTSWVYARHGHNFVKTVLRLAAERETLRIIDDQIGTPTSARLIAEVTALAIEKAQANPDLGGLYHLVAGGETSWYHYARRIIDEARARGMALAVNTLEPVTSRDYPTAATRPLNSRLDTGKLRQRFGVDLPPWHEGVAQLIDELTGRTP